MKFIEQYIDEEPKENYWRGITCVENGIHLFDIEYCPKKNKFDEKTHFYIRCRFFPEIFFSYKTGDRILITSIFKEDGRRRIFYDKEAAKLAAVNAKDEFLKMLS
jgi:hypothetical protein